VGVSGRHQECADGGVLPERHDRHSRGGHYDAAGFSWSAAADPDDSSIYAGNTWHRRVRTVYSGTIRSRTPPNARRSGRSTKTRAKSSTSSFNSSSRSDVPTIILYFNKEPFVYKPDLQGFEPSAVISPFWNPWEYSI